jgi:hypothetical protein
MVAHLLFHLFKGVAFAAFITAGLCWDTSGWLLFWVVVGWVANCVAMAAYDVREMQ